MVQARHAGGGGGTAAGVGEAGVVQAGLGLAAPLPTRLHGRRGARSGPRCRVCAARRGAGCRAGARLPPDGDTRIHNGPAPLCSHHRVPPARLAAVVDAAYSPSHQPGWLEQM